MKGRTAGDARHNRSRQAKPHETLHIVLVPVPVTAAKPQRHKKAGGTVQGSSMKPRLDKRARGGKLPLHRDLGGFIGNVPESAWLGLAGAGMDMAGGAPIGRALNTGASIRRLMHGPRRDDDDA